MRLEMIVQFWLYNKIFYIWFYEKCWYNLLSICKLKYKWKNETIYINFQYCKNCYKYHSQNIYGIHTYINNYTIIIIVIITTSFYIILNGNTLLMLQYIRAVYIETYILKWNENDEKEEFMTFITCVCML